MVGIELVKNSTTKEAFAPSDLFGKAVCQQAIERGVWVRPLSDVVILMPPLVASEQELESLADTVIESIEAVLPIGVAAKG